LEAYRNTCTANPVRQLIEGNRALIERQRLVFVEQRARDDSRDVVSVTDTARHLMPVIAYEAAIKCEIAPTRNTMNARRTPPWIQLLHQVAETTHEVESCTLGRIEL
jgi:hypothetical protein